MTWHQTIIVGNLGRDPEMRYTQDGTAVCSFSVAVSERLGKTVVVGNAGNAPLGIE